MSRATLWSAFAAAMANAVHAGRMDNALRAVRYRSRRSPGTGRPRYAYAHGPGSIGEYDAAMRAFLEADRMTVRPTRFVQPVRNTSL
jgi:hypothetical protein